MSEEPKSERNERRTRGTRARVLAVVSIASIFGFAVWFSTNAVAEALEVEKDLDSGEIA